MLAHLAADAGDALAADVESDAELVLARASFTRPLISMQKSGNLLASGSHSQLHCIHAI
jgi:hypothetical protein